MRYISTREAHSPIESAAAINLGLAPGGGLYIPETFPHCSFEQYLGERSYQQIAYSILKLLLTDYSKEELEDCISRAYNPATFDTPSIINLVHYGSDTTVMELWHGPTAAFKDIALQIMPHLLMYAKRKTGNNQHTVILVATSGDTGKAALDGFCNAEGISIVVFFPHGGVSEVQRLQMVTTGGTNTAVIAVEGNFDDCQTGVKRLFSDEHLRWELSGRHVEFSSANSINWGRLSPQIVYYFAAYAQLVRNGHITAGDQVDFIVPTGNFGNILAGYYAKRMGLPIDKLICASNRNKVLADFFETGTYSRNRVFFRTSAPAMDILISSNLERFLFEMCGRNHAQIKSWYMSLSETGSFSVDAATMAAMKQEIIGGWVDEHEIKEAIKKVHTTYGYIPDTHTAVAVAIAGRLNRKSNHTIILSTASPYKFSRDVYAALEKDVIEDELVAIQRIHSISGIAVHRAVSDIEKRAIHHEKVIPVSMMRSTVIEYIDTIIS